MLDGSRRVGRALPPRSVNAQSGSALVDLIAVVIFEEKMKSCRRRRIQEAPKDLAAHFREWQELRIKVSEAELAAEQRSAADVNVKAKAQSARKPAGRGRVH